MAGVLWCVVWLATWSDGPYIRSGKAVAAADAEPVADTVSEEAEEPAVPWRRIFTTRTFISGVLLVMSVYALVTVVLTWLPSYFEVGLGYSRLQAGSMFAFPSIVGLILMLLSSTVGDRLATRGASSRKVRIIVPSVGVLVCGAMLFALPSISTPALAVLVVSVGYGFAATVFPLLNAAISETYLRAPWVCSWRSWPLAASSRRTQPASSSTPQRHRRRDTRRPSKSSVSSPRSARCLHSCSRTRSVTRHFFDRRRSQTPRHRERLTVRELQTHCGR